MCANLLGATRMTSGGSRLGPTSLTDTTVKLYSSSLSARAAFTSFSRGGRVKVTDVAFVVEELSFCTRTTR